jgi:hypothetical protein
MLDVEENEWGIMAAIVHRPTGLGNRPAGVTMGKEAGGKMQGTRIPGQ